MVLVQVKVLLLESDEMRATITPQWGGRLWGLASKRTGRDLMFDNKVFQPTNDALRQAYQQGGSEWNFGPQIGHMSQVSDRPCNVRRGGRAIPCNWRVTPL